MAGYRAWVLAAALCLGAVACGGDDSSDESSDNGTDDEQVVDEAAGSGDEGGSRGRNRKSFGGFSSDRCPSFDAFNEVAAIPAEVAPWVETTAADDLVGDLEGISCLYNDEAGTSITALDVARVTGDRTAEEKCRDEYYARNDVEGVLEGAVTDNEGRAACAWKGDIVVNVYHFGQPQEGKGIEFVRLLIDSFGI